MEEKALKKAAREGNTSVLEELLDENPLLLNEVMPLFTETPLHIAALAGQADFAKLLLQRAPSLARQQSSRKGLNALHIAAARGHADVVSVLLHIDQQLDLIGDIEGSTPLHYAAYYGMVDVAKLLLCNNPVVLKRVNLKGETAIHIAVKCEQLQVTKVLREALNKLEVGYRGTEDGNRNLQFFVNNHTQTGFPALTYTQPPQFCRSLHVEADAQHHKNFEVDNKYEFLEKKIAREAMLVIGILIATVTFQAIMNPPQSIWKDGVPNHARIKFYVFFLACNSVSFLASCIGIFAASKDTRVLNFWVSSSLTWAAASYICVLISMMEKNVVQKVISASLIMIIPNVIISLCLYSRKVIKLMRRIEVFAQL